MKAIRRKLEKYQDCYLFICNNYFMLILADVSAYMSVAVIMHMICILDMFITHMVQSMTVRPIFFRGGSLSTCQLM